MTSTSNSKLIYKCDYCNKEYIRKSNYNTHLNSCKLYNYCRARNNFCDSHGNGVLEIDKMDITTENIFKMLIILHNKYEKLEADYSELKKFVNVTKNKIDILEYLNQNCVSQFENSCFDTFMNAMIIDNDCLDFVFKKDYIDGVYDIIVSNIQWIKDKSLNIPIKCFNQKDGILYIYERGSNERGSNERGSNERGYGSWIIMDGEYFKKLIKHIDKKILMLFLEWKLHMESTLDAETYSDIYIKNMKKVIGGNFVKKHTNLSMIIKNKLYKHLRVDIKNITTYEFM